MNGEVTHQCPPTGSGVMPCCGRAPLEVPRRHRMTLDPALVTCREDRTVDAAAGVFEGGPESTGWLRQQREADDE